MEKKYEDMVEDLYSQNEENKPTEEDIHEIYSDNLKKPYFYGKYKDVVLYVFKKPTPSGFNFLVEYPGGLYYYGFKTWNEASSCAKSLKQRVKTLNWLLGG